MIILIDAKKLFEKNLIPTMKKENNTKPLIKAEIEGNFLNLIKKKTAMSRIANIILKVRN